jgi:Ca2+-binding EF-hand superfamily protein
MRSSSLSFPAAVLGLLTIVQTANAQPTVPREAFDQLPRADQNRDGSVTRAEFLAYRATQFARFDRNRDGVLSNADRPPRQVERMAGLDIDALYAAFDLNRDGQVTRAEFNSAPTPAFDVADANKNNVVDRDELAAARRQARG